jgi:hypothetical protein
MVKKGMDPNQTTSEKCGLFLYIPCTGRSLGVLTLPILLQEICGPILGMCKSLTDMNVEIETETGQFPEKEYINGISVAVQAGVIQTNKSTTYRMPIVPIFPLQTGLGTTTVFRW